MNTEQMRNEFEYEEPMNKLDELLDSFTIKELNDLIKPSPDDMVGRLATVALLLKLNADSCK
jgi:hypothetical protein